MSYQDIVNDLVEIITPLANGHEDINEHTELTGELGLDSLKVMNMMLAVEDKYDISIPMNAMAEIRTVGEFAKQIEKWTSENV